MAVDDPANRPATDPASAPSPPTPPGLVLSPFRALRYAAGTDLAAVTSPPYDVIDDDGVDELERRHQNNVVRLILPRDSDAGADDRYVLAATALTAWRDAGVLAVDETPALYVYEEATDGHVQRGLLGAVGLAAPAAGIVLPHEDTMAGPVADRLALTEATQANLEPIFLVYDGGGAASAAVAAAGPPDSADEPLAEAVTGDGVHHRLWAITDPGTLADIAADLLPRRATIADGHHRYATYLRHQADRHAAGDGPGPWDQGLAFLVDASTFGPEVHAIHRVVAGVPVEAAVTRAGAGFTVTPVAGEVEAAAALALAGKAGPAFVLAGHPEADRTRTAAWFLLSDPDPAGLWSALPADRAAAWRGLDVAVAHRYLVGTLLGVDDSVESVRFAHDVPEALGIAGATGGTALLLNPTPVEAVAAVAAAGERMPRKSTLFTPKPRTGMVVRAFGDQG